MLRLLIGVEQSIIYQKLPLFYARRNRRVKLNHAQLIMLI